MKGEKVRKRKQKTAQPRLEDQKSGSKKDHLVTK